MLLTFSHIQKDDSLVPLLPYATGCFLASVLLTISGIAETHPQALALATYLIQFGWLLLQIQGVMLVYMFGSQGQGGWLFRIWLVSMQLLDVHRRILSGCSMGVGGSGLFAEGAGGVRGESGGGGSGLNGTSVFGSLAIVGESGSGSGHGDATFGNVSPGRVQSMIGQHNSAAENGGDNEEALLQDVKVIVWGYYSGMLCKSAPASICDLITSSSSPSSLSSSASASVLSFLSTLVHTATTFSTTTMTTATTTTLASPSVSQAHAYSTRHDHSRAASAPTEGGGGGSGMKEMEKLVVFEILAGVVVSGLMCFVWAVMAIRRGGVVAIPGVRRTMARMQRWGKMVKMLRDEWKGVLGAKVDAVVEQMKFRVDS